MNSKELIEELLKFRQELTVMIVTDGDYEHIESIGSIQISSGRIVILLNSSVNEETDYISQVYP